MTLGMHWRCVTFAVLHSKLLQAILEVFLLRYEDDVALLSYLKTNEELHLTHHGHLILLLHHVSKLITVFLISAAEDNVIHGTKQFSIICLREERGIQGTRFEAFALQEVLECVIPSTRGLFEAIQCLVELINHVRMFWIFKARWLCDIHFFFNRSIEKKRSSHPFDTEVCYDDLHRLAVCVWLQA